MTLSGVNHAGMPAATVITQPERHALVMPEDCDCGMCVPTWARRRGKSRRHSESVSLTDALASSPATGATLVSSSRAVVSVGAGRVIGPEASPPADGRTDEAPSATIASSRVSPSRTHGWQPRTCTARTPGPTVIVTGPFTAVYCARSCVLVDFSRPTDPLPPAGPAVRYTPGPNSSPTTNNPSPQAPPTCRAERGGDCVVESVAKPHPRLAAPDLHRPHTRAHSDRDRPLHRGVLREVMRARRLQQAHRPAPASRPGCPVHPRTQLKPDHKQPVPPRHRRPGIWCASAL